MPRSKKMKKVTMITLCTGVGTGCTMRWNVFCVNKPSEVKVQKNFPKNMRVEVDEMELEKSDPCYKRAVALTEKGGKINWWDEARYCVSCPWADGRVAAFVYLPRNMASMVNDD